MSRPRITIVHLILVVLVAAVGLAAIRNATASWAGAISSITFFAMICSLLGVAWGRDTRRVYWSGFAALGWGYFLLGYIPRVGGMTVGDILLAPLLFDRLDDALHPLAQAAGGLQSVPMAPLGAAATGGGFGGAPVAAPGGFDRAAFFRIGVSLEMLLWAFLGGWAARYFASGRGRSADQAP